MFVVGVPLMKDNKPTGGVYLYQSLSEIEEPAQYTTKFILLAAGIAIILTTIFAFFLSTRITAPLRKMRQAAFEVTKGNFDTKVPILTHDEIGELAIAFNQMGRQLKFNLNALNQEKEQLSSILSSMADGVITFSRDGSILITNPPAEHFLQTWYYEQDVNNQQVPELPANVVHLFQTVVETETERSAELKIQGKTWVILMSPLYNQTKIRGAVAVLRAMSEERKLDKSLRMGRLVNELLDLARMEAGHVQLHLESVAMVEFTERVLRKFQGLAKEKHIKLSLNGKIEDEFEAMIDSDRMEQVLTNLIDNAIRHTDDYGEVKLHLDKSQSEIHLSVQDTGAGIPKEDLPFVFERFYKADKARTRGRSGTGLGLAIAKNIVEAHQGIIAVESELNEGTTFFIKLPK